MIRSKRELADLSVGTGENWIGNLPNKDLHDIYCITARIVFSVPNETATIESGKFSRLPECVYLLKMQRNIGKT